MSKIKIALVGSMLINYKLKVFTTLILIFTGTTLADDRIDLVYFGNKEDSALLGVGQGLEDNQLKNQYFNLQILEPDIFKSLDNPRPLAIFASVDAESLRILSELNPKVPVFNLVEGHDDLRALCLPNLFHIIPSNKMREDAIKLWSEKIQNIQPEATAWHHDIKNDRAAELNARFLDIRGFPMGEQPWAGWVAASIVTTNIIQFQSKNTAALFEYLKTELRVDGLKEYSLSFRPNGQLRHIFLMVEDDKILGTVPDYEITKDSDLDMFGYSHCP
jgi:hypothetical protein